MPYIGQQPTSVAFLTDTFSGNGSTTAFTLSAAPAGTSSILVAISGVVQDPSTYSVVGTTLTFSPAPPTGTGNISVRFLGIPASGVTTTAYRTVTEFTATAAQTTFSTPSYTPGFIDVYRNGVMLGSADYTATNGVSVVLASGATAGDLIEVISFSVSSVLNAIPNSPASVGTSNIANGVTINFADGSASTPSITNDGDTNTGIFFPAADTIAFAEGGAEVARFDASGNLGIGTSSPTFGGGGGLHIKNSADANVRISASSFTGLDLLQQTGTGTAYIWNRDNALMLFGTNNTERVRIDSAGCVTTPFQPAFRAGNALPDVTVTVAANSKITHVNTASLNRGSCYNNSTQRFTAPVSGVYYFNANLWVDGGATASLMFLLNGGIQPKGGTGDSVTSNLQGNGEPQRHLSLTLIVQLTANDYVELWTRNQSWTGYTGHSWWQGYLIG